MKNFTLKEKGWETPGINFDYQKGTLEISGKLMGNNTQHYFKNMFSWVNAYIEAPQAKTLVYLSIEAIATSETKYLLDLLKLLKGLLKQGKELQIVWLYDLDDEDMIEMGENYQYFTKLPFELIEIEERGAA